MLVYQCDCFCDRCCDWQGTAETRHGSADGLARVAREVAKSFGWKRIRKSDGTYEDVCPNCAKHSTPF